MWIYMNRKSQWESEAEAEEEEKKKKFKKGEIKKKTRPVQVHSLVAARAKKSIFYLFYIFFCGKPVKTMRQYDHVTSLYFP